MFLLIPDWLNAFNFLVSTLGVILLTGGAWIVLSLRRSSGISELQTDRATAAEALVRTRETELIDLHKKLAEAEEELEAVTAEHRTVSGIKVAELMDFWARKEEFEAEHADLERKFRVLQKRKDGDI